MSRRRPELTEPEKPVRKRGPESLRLAEVPRLPRRIPLELHAEVVAKLRGINPQSGKPWTSRDVVVWLREVHGVKVSHTSVLRVYAIADAAGKRLMVEALQETMRDQVAPLIARLKRTTKRLDEMASRSRSTKDVASAVNAMTRSLDAFARLGAVAAPAAVDVTSGGKTIDVRASLEAKLARLAAEPDPDPSTGTG